MTPADAAMLLLEALGKAYADTPEVTVTVVPGAILADDWCWGGCGTAYVRLDAAYPSTRFPNPDVGGAPCGTLRAARFHVGVNRCVTGMDETGAPPSPESQTEDALALMMDSDRVYCAIRDATSAGWRSGSTMLGSWVPVGPLGNCAGGYWAVTVRL